MNITISDDEHLKNVKLRDMRKLEMRGVELYGHNGRWSPDDISVIITHVRFPTGEMCP